MATAAVKNPPVKQPPPVYVLELSQEEAQAVKDIMGALGTHELNDLAKNRATPSSARIGKLSDGYASSYSPVSDVYFALSGKPGIR